MPHPDLETFLGRSAREPFGQVVECLADGAVELSELLRTAPLRDLLGPIESPDGEAMVNATGDTQKKIDLLANELFIKRVTSKNLVHRIVSEENESPLNFENLTEPPLLLALDPLDGSSNIDVNGVVGTVFGIYRDEREPFPTGRELLAAGYFLYGPSTMLMISVGEGTHGFTLNPESGKFELTIPDLSCKEHGPYLCANVAHFSEWPDTVQSFVDDLIRKSRVELTPVSLRYSGSMSKDAHLILLHGGLYAYPPDAQHWTGKIRLLYESIPMAFLFEQAGGTSSNCMQNLLDVQPLEPHQQDHTVLGSHTNVQDYVRAALFRKAA